MNGKFQLSWIIILGIVFLIGFSLMALLFSQNEVTAFDRAIIAFVQGLESPSLTAVMKFFTFIGSFKAIIVISLFTMALLYAVLKHRIELILFTIVLVGTPILNRLLKEFFQRARPDLHRLIEIGGYSFPSGHAMNAASMYGILAFLLWRHIPTRWGRSLLIIFSSAMIVTIGISRIYLGVHYPSDIIAGYLASGCWLAITIAVFQRYQEKRSSFRVDRNSA